MTTTTHEGLVRYAHQISQHGSLRFHDDDRRFEVDARRDDYDPAIGDAMKRLRAATYRSRTTPRVRVTAEHGFVDVMRNLSGPIVREDRFYVTAIDILDIDEAAGTP